jgi:predicted RNase H-like HicB family nuclease
LLRAGSRKEGGQARLQRLFLAVPAGGVAGVGVSGTIGRGREVYMLTEYVQKAMASAVAEKTEEGEYVASIPGIQGPWASGKTRKEAKEELRPVFEEWLVLALREDEELPELDGASLNFGGKRWQKQPAAAR